jgi:hypothetical protein
MYGRKPMYLIVSYEQPGRYRYWSGRQWTAARRRARRYAAGTNQFRKALESAQAGRQDRTVGLLPAGA